MSTIYKITNKINNKSYIGQTNGTAEMRFNKHLSNLNSKNRCSALYSAIKKYGKENFTLETIFIDEITKEELNLLEEYYIKKFNTLSPNGYNLQSGGKSNNLHESVKKKISDSLKNRKITWSDKISETMKKKWKDEKYRKNISSKHKGKRGKYKKHEKPLRCNLPIEEINELYNNGATIYYLTKKYKVSYGAIKKRLK